jgi:hypothetical protein
MKKESIMKDNDMKDEYDFSKGVRGKFYNKTAKFHLPVYLEPEVENFFTNLATKQKSNLTQIINNLLLKDKELIEMAMTRA